MFLDDDQEDLTNTGTSKSSKSSDEHKLDLAKRETKAVFRLRLLVFLALMLACLAVSTIVYQITMRSEWNEYETQFEGAAEKVLETFLDVARGRLGIIASLAVTLTSSASDQQQEWPFVTMSNFQQRAAAIRDHSGAVYIHINPFVMEGDRKNWEEFLVGDGAYIL